MQDKFSEELKTSDEPNAIFTSQDFSEMREAYEDEIKGKKREKPLSARALRKESLKQVPFLKEVLERLEKTGKVLTKLITTDVHHTSGKALEHAATGFHIVGMILAAVDFIAIPFIYLAAFIQGKKVPFKLTNNARWAYSALLLTLAVLSFAVPVTAPFILLTTAITGLSISMLSVVNLFRERGALKKKILALSNEISKLDEDLKKQLQSAEGMQNNFNNINNCSELEKNFAPYKEKFNETLRTYHQAKKELAHSKQKLANLQKPSTTIFRALAVIVSMGVLAGAITSFFFPPAGIAVLATCAGVGLSLFIAKLIADKKQATVKPIVGEINKEEKLEVNQGEGLQYAPQNSLKLEHDKSLDTIVIEEKTEPLSENKPSSSASSVYIMQKLHNNITDDSPPKKIEDSSEKDNNNKQTEEHSKEDKKDRESEDEGEEESESEGEVPESKEVFHDLNSK